MFVLCNISKAGLLVRGQLNLPKCLVETQTSL